jgi:hypothetical protein
MRNILTPKNLQLFAKIHILPILFLFLRFDWVNQFPFLTIAFARFFSEINKPWFFPQQNWLYGLLCVGFWALLNFDIHNRLPLVRDETLNHISLYFVRSGFVYILGSVVWLGFRLPVGFLIMWMGVAVGVLFGYQEIFKRNNQTDLRFILIILWLIICNISGFYILFNN